MGDNLNTWNRLRDGYLVSVCLVGFIVQDWIIPLVLLLSLFWLEGRGKNRRKIQRAKKVMSNSPRLVDFAIGLVIFVLNLPNGQVLFLEKFNLRKDCNQSC